MKSFSEASALQGSSFQLLNSPYDALLLDLAQVKDKGSNERVDQFSLFFKGPLDKPLPQNLYQLQHETLGQVDWMLVPVGLESDGYVYEAAFNLLKELAIT